MERTDLEIITQTEELARKFAKSMGWEFASHCRPWNSHNPRALEFWRMACIAQDTLTGTEVSKSLRNWQDEQEDEA